MYDNTLTVASKGSAFFANEGCAKTNYNELKKMSRNKSKNSFVKRNNL